LSGEEQRMMDQEIVLCTGARGFIGSHLVRRLAAKGDEVWCLLGPGEEPDPLAEGNVRWVRGNVADPLTLEAIRRPFSAVYHLAALNTSRHPAQLYLVNYQGTVNVASAVMACGEPPRRFLLASSYGAMGPAVNADGLSEGSPCRPVSDYGRSKLKAELFLGSLRDRLPVTIVRLPLVYGPGSKGGLYQYFRLIDKGFCPCLTGGEATLGFVGDMVEGIILAARDPAAEGETFLLGDDRASSLEEILTSIEDALGRKAVRVRLPRQAVLFYAWLAEKADFIGGANGWRFRQTIKGFVQYPSWKGNVAKAREKLGFRARISFEEGARITAVWYRENGLI
jgi:nucleoside-diphosphate-sugar epimerase